MGKAAGWIAALAAVTGLIHLGIPGVFDSDTAYHLAVARIIGERGILHGFPWTPFSWLAEHYADKELIFHLLLVPVAHLEPVTASRIAGTVLGTGLLATLFILLSREGVTGAGPWTLAALCSSSAFIARFAMVRPHLLSITLAMVIAWAAARRRNAVLAAAAALFPLSYTAWHLPLVLALLVTATDFISGRRPDGRVLVITGAALCFGVVVHPNFPANLHLFWIQNFEVLFRTAWMGIEGVDLGGEFRPFSPAGLGRYVLIPALLTLLSVGPAWAVRRENTLPLTVTVVAVGFLVVTLRSQRFLEYLVPFSVMAAALTRKSPRHRALVPALIVTGILLMLTVADRPLRLMRETTELFPPDVRERVGLVIPPSSQVVTCDWRFTGQMMLALPGRRFLVALDPVFFAINDPERYRLWYETVRRPPREPALALRDAFDAGYVMCTTDRKWEPFLQALHRDPHAALRGAVGHWRIYQLRPRETDGKP